MHFGMRGRSYVQRVKGWSRYGLGQLVLLFWCSDAIEEDVAQVLPIEFQ